MSDNEIIIKDTHRGLWYEDGVLARTLPAGRYEIPKKRLWHRLPGLRRLEIEVTLVDMRERDLTIKGQEILTADKVAIRVSIIVRFQVTDPKAAIHAVEDYESRIYSDVQLAARRSLASMSLNDILTNRNQLSEDILADVQEGAAGYGVAIGRADVKDLIFPGNLQEIMNRVLTAERLAEANLIEARSRAETERVSAESRLATRRLESEAQLEANRRESEARIERERSEAEARVEADRRNVEARIALEQREAEARAEANRRDAEARIELDQINAEARIELERRNATAQAERQQVRAEADAAESLRMAEADAEVQRIQTEAEVAALALREKSAGAYRQHPALLRLVELHTLGELGQNANARLYVDLDREKSSEKDS